MFDKEELFLDIIRNKYSHELYDFILFLSDFIYRYLAGNILHEHINIDLLKDTLYL